MSGWLLDASVLLAAEDSDDPNHADARRLLEAADPVATLDLALYETVNVAIAAWGDAAAARRLRELIAAVSDDGGLIRADPALLDNAARIALEHGISVYDAAYVAAARAARARLVSCDAADLVSRQLAVLPSQANV
ncbi:MAG: PIN domain-containing protein [Solirubrobacteraceae bacterium]|jgi:predicted nucleic acid-binding protein